MKRAVLFLVCLLLVIGGWIWKAPSVDAAEVNRGILDQQQQKGDRLVKRLGITETLGPLAPVALSPFFGLTCLSATSILCERGVLPDNEFLTGNEVLTNGWVFLIFLALTVVTSAPRLVSASKVFAEATDRIETYAGIISYAVILMFAQQDTGAEQMVVYSAGFFSMTGNGLLACCAAINIFVISTVRLFFELLVLISPIPTLDAIFECANKSVCGILAVIYAFNPWLAFVINVLIFLICLVIFKWVNRRVRYMKALLLEPILLKIIRSLFGLKRYDPDAGALRRISSNISGVELVVKCFPSGKLGKIKTKDRCYLVFGANTVSLIKPRLLSSDILMDIDAAGISRDITEGLLSYSVSVPAPSGRGERELIFSRIYTQKLDTISSRLAALTDSKSTS